MSRCTKIFSKSLKDTDIKKRMAIPAKALSSLPDFNGGHAVKILLIYGTRTWPIVYSIRKKGNYKKPVFSGGWRDFVRCNKFNIGDQLTLYKVEDEAGSTYYRVDQEEKPSHSSTHELADQTTGKNNFENEQEKVVLLKVTKQEETVTELGDDVDVAADAAPVSFGGGHACAIAKPSSIRIFGTNVSHFKSTTPEELSKMRSIICKGTEPPVLVQYYSFNIMKSFHGLNEDVAAAYGAGTSQLAAVGDVYNYRITSTETETEAEGLSLDLILAQPTPIHNSELVNVDLTLAPPIPL